MTLVITPAIANIKWDTTSHITINLTRKACLSQFLISAITQRISVQVKEQYEETKQLSGTRLRTQTLELSNRELTITVIDMLRAPRGKEDLIQEQMQ